MDTLLGLRKVKRLQGKEWHDNKPFFKMRAYSVSSNGNIRVEVKDKRNGRVFSHWLNEVEKDKFIPVKENYRRL